MSPLAGLHLLGLLTQLTSGHRLAGPSRIYSRTCAYELLPDVGIRGQVRSWGALGYSAGTIHALSRAWPFDV
jgi:hypothetical protein